MDAGATRTPYNPARGWLVLLIVWLACMPAYFWWVIIHGVLNIPFHPRWNAPFTAALCLGEAVAWIAALNYWINRGPRRADSDAATTQHRRVARYFASVVLSTGVLASVVFTAFWSWQFTGDSTGTKEIVAQDQLSELRYLLATYNASHGSLDGLRSGPVLNSGLVERDRDLGISDWPVWPAGNLYVEIQGSAPDYAGTTLTAKGDYWPGDETAPSYRTFRLVVGDIRDFDSDRLYGEWAEP